MIGVLVFICVSLGLVNSAPINCKEPQVINFDAINSDGFESDTSDVVKKPIDGTLLLDLLRFGRKTENVNVNQPETRDYFNGPLQSVYVRDDGQLASLPSGYQLASEDLPLAEMSYQKDRGVNTDETYMDYYDSGLYPLVRYSLSAALNPELPLSSVYPMYSTKIHETVSQDRSSLDIDTLNDYNFKFLPSNLRPVRSRDDDFLADLSHDAMMPNILPRMQIPLDRDAEAVYQVAQSPQAGTVTAVYPTAARNGCAVPILLGCTPSITYGALTNANDGNAATQSSTTYQKHVESDVNRFYDSNINEHNKRKLMASTN